MKKLTLLLLTSAFFSFTTTYADESVWQSYYEMTKNGTKPRPTLEKTLELFDQEDRRGVAIDLGSGAGLESAFLVEKGWFVYAVDAELIASHYLMQKIPEEKQKNVHFILAKFEDFIFPENVLLVNASYALPFCDPFYFDELMSRIVNAIEAEGRFSGQFFGLNDSWADSEKYPKALAKVFLTKDQILSYFPNFEVAIEEGEFDGKSGTGDKHWHIYHVVAKKRSYHE